MSVLSEKTKLPLGFLIGFLAPAVAGLRAFDALEAKVYANSKVIDRHELVIEKISAMQADIAAIKVLLEHRQYVPAKVIRKR